MTTLQGVKLLMFMNCREAAPLISQAMDQKLAPPARAGVAMHLAICRSCRRYRGQLNLLRRVLALIGSGSNPSPAQILGPEARMRIQAALTNHRRREGGA